MKKSEIKAIIFDVGGVLEDYKYPLALMRKHTHLSVHDFVAKKLNLNLDQWFDAIDSAYAKAIEGKITKKQEINIVSKNLKINPKKLEKLWISSYKRYFKKNKMLFNTAKKLKKASYIIAILSDQHYISKEALISHKDIKFFDYVLVSCDIKLRKPNPGVYKFTLKKLKVKPEEALFIDNQVWNIKPAKKLGMKTILFRNNKQTIKELKKRGVNL